MIINATIDLSDLHTIRLPKGDDLDTYPHVFIYDRQYNSCLVRLPTRLMAERLADLLSEMMAQRDAKTEDAPCEAA